jgi:hypothetical protein
MGNKRTQPDPKAIKELVQLYIAMEKTADEEEFQPLLKRHDEITKSLGFPQILFRSLEDMKNRRHFPINSTP